MDIKAKKKYRLIEIETPKNQTEIEEYESPYLVIGKAIGKLILKVFKFSIYICIATLELIIKLIKALFNLNEYNPLGFISEAREKALDDRAAKNINKERMRFATEKLTRHTYEFERSEIYNLVYKEIQDKLKDFADNNVAINRDIYKDILNKIDILTVEVEKKALDEGYNYATFTKYRFSDEEEIYSNFIEYKIMKGEGHGKIDKKQWEGRNWW